MTDREDKGCNFVMALQSVTLHCLVMCNVITPPL